MNQYLHEILTVKNIIPIAVTIVSIIWGLVPLFLKMKFDSFRKQLSTSELNDSEFNFPKVAVIMPCKGYDVSFENNLEKVLKQNYPNWEIHFSVATTKDEAYEHLNRLTLFNPKKVSLHVAGIKTGCGQKMTNMVKALDYISKDVEVLVFMDADTSVHPNFLRKIVKGLYLPNVGASTGYHVFLPQNNRWGSFIRTVWALAGCLVLADESKNFAIGAATAIKKSDFAKLDIKTKLQNTLSDTFVFTNTIKAAGMKVLFNPECLFISPDDSNIKQVSDWSDRLTLLSKTYSFSFWKLISMSYAFAAIFYSSWILYILFNNPLWIFPSLALAITQMLMGLLLVNFTSSLIKQFYPVESELLLKHQWKMALMSPVTGLLMISSTVKSIFKNTTTWRGITYKLHSAENVEIISES